MKIYVAGPMSGYEDCNYPAFAQVTQVLRNAGYEVVSPAEINPDQTTGYAVAMRNDIRELVTCDAIWMMEGWPHSKGAMLEFQIAVVLGLQIKGVLP